MADRNPADDGAVSHVRFSPLGQQFADGRARRSIRRMLAQIRARDMYGLDRRRSRGAWEDGFRPKGPRLCPLAN